MGLSLDNPNSLKVGIPTSPRQVVSVADPVAVDRAFITDFTARHEGNLPSEVNDKYSSTAL
jgi:hypothetical protein